MKCSEARVAYARSFASQGAHLTPESAVQHARDCEACRRFEIQLAGMDAAYDRTILTNPPLDLISRVNREYLNPKPERTVAWSRFARPAFMLLLLVALVGGVSYWMRHSPSPQDTAAKNRQKPSLSAGKKKGAPGPPTTTRSSSSNNDQKQNGKILYPESASGEDEDDDTFDRISQKLDKNIEENINVNDIAEDDEKDKSENRHDSGSSGSSGFDSPHPDVTHRISGKPSVPVSGSTSSQENQSDTNKTSAAISVSTEESAEDCASDLAADGSTWMADPLAENNDVTAQADAILQATGWSETAASYEAAGASGRDFALVSSRTPTHGFGATESLHMSDGEAHVEDEELNDGALQGSHDLSYTLNYCAVDGE